MVSIRLAVEAPGFSRGTAGFSPRKYSAKNRRALAPEARFFMVYGCIPIQSIWLVVTAPAPPAVPFCSVISNVVAVWFDTNSPVSAALLPWPIPALQVTA